MRLLVSSTVRVPNCRGYPLMVNFIWYILKQWIVSKARSDRLCKLLDLLLIKVPISDSLIIYLFNHLVPLHRLKRSWTSKVNQTVGWSNLT